MSTRTAVVLRESVSGFLTPHFGSLQYVMAGAEKLPERISVAFEDRFGIRPLEGYGCTECSPVVTVDTRDFRAAQFRQVGAERTLAPENSI